MSTLSSYDDDDDNDDSFVVGRVHLRSSQTFADAKRCARGDGINSQSMLNGHNQSLIADSLADHNGRFSRLWRIYALHKIVSLPNF